MAQQKFEVSIPGGDRVVATLEIDGGKISGSSWTVTGSLALVEAAKLLKNQIKGDIDQLAVPSGTAPAQLILKKLVLKIKGQWLAEDSDPELCHCRKIPQTHVERAIILGAHTVEKIRQRTSANTGCGTCLPDVETILEKYLN